MVDKPQFSVEGVVQKGNYARFVISPLPLGMGHSLGNSLRRALLTVIPGAAITQMKVSGVSHQFSTLKGVKEDLIEIILNIKQLRFIYEGEKAVSLKLEKRGPGEVKGKDIDLAAGVKLANPDLVIANLADKNSTLKIEFTLEKGFGYSLADDHKTEKVGIIAIDAIFSPVIKTNYKVEPTRVGKKSDWDSLTIEVWTDKTIVPKKAIEQSAKIMADYFLQIVKPKAIKIKKEIEMIKNEMEEDFLIEDLELPLRLTNALKKADFSKVKDLITVGKEKVRVTKNVGEKSLKLIEKVLGKKGIKWS